MMIRINKGQDLPITGAPKPGHYSRAQTRQVGVMGGDFLDLKVSLKVDVGTKVNVGTALFEDKRHPGVMHTSPIAGVVVAVNRGERRAFQSVVVERDGREDYQAFSRFHHKPVAQYSRQEVIDLLSEAGMWPALRTRPFNKTPSPQATPHSLFITAIDSNPLSAAPDAFVQEHQVAFYDGVQLLSLLSDGLTHVCVRPGFQFRVPENDRIKVTMFEGPHPAGNVGTHIHFLEPVHAKKTVWHIGYQDVVAVGKLFGTGKYFSERWFAIGGPIVRNPRVIKTHLGADLMELTKQEAQPEVEARIVAGSPLHGRACVAGPYQFQHRFMSQITLLKEEREREFLGWHSPGFDRFSVMRTFLSKLMPGKKFDMGTSRHGSFRAIVPVGVYERMMPMDIMATHLLKALASNDTENAVLLGALELDEEDLALCTFVDPGKTDFGALLRQNLHTIELEG